MIDISVELAGIKLKNPIMPASGCFGYGREFAPLYDLNILGAIAIKSITQQPRFGNPTPRIAETPSGMLNAIGLQNKGVEYVLEHELPFLSAYDTPIFANIAGASEEEYVEVIKRLNYSEVISAYELNISCPNVKHGGIGLGSNECLASKVTSMCKKVAQKPLFVKLSPNVTDIVSIARAVEDAGVDGLVLINTLLGMRIDLKSAKPLLANKTGGLSGPAIKPVAIRMVYEVAKAVKIPIIGVGGIQKAEDVLEFLNAGASAVQVGAENFVNPYICPELIDDLPKVLQKYGYDTIQKAIKRSINV